ncbi:MAG: ABC transporter substrate-binding protein [Promethearchaeota archaeon]
MMKKLKSQGYLYLLLIILVSCNIGTFNPESGEKTLEKTDNTLLKLKSNQVSEPFIVGVSSGPHSIDPINSWDSASDNVIVQVCEGLFQYNLSDPSMPRVNHLAESYWWKDDTTLQIKLREGIFFHDTYPFKAIEAAWNINRILYFTNSSGTLPGNMTIADPSSLYYFPDGTPIINSVATVSEYNITITLNNPYGPFLDLLCFPSSYMVSPYSTPADDYIDLYTGDLVGTGPFIYNGYTPNVEVNFTAFDTYWQGKADINDMTFLVLLDSVSRSNAMLNHEIDYLQGPIPSMFPTFEADPSITVMKFTDTYGVPSLTYNYLGMNNMLINLSWRKAISYAINYTYIIKELMNDLAIRANSPISPAFGAAYNASVAAADYDLATARQVLVDAGIAPGYPVNSDPNDPTWLAANLLTINYTYNLGNKFREDMYDALHNWLSAIGIFVEDDGTTWSDFLMKLYVYPDKLGLYWSAWIPDFKDPYNLLDALFSPWSAGNSAQVNDAKLNSMMATALATVDDPARNAIYKNIQSYLAERLYPHCFGFHPKITEVHSSRLSNVPYNAFLRLYFYPCKWTLPFHIYIDDSDPNYDWSKTALENDWCTGSGSWGDPYVISNLEINGINLVDCIEIKNSNAYFELRNCTIHQALQYGIKLSNTNNSLIYNNSIYDNPIGGLYAEYSNNHSIYDNKFWNITNGYNGYGIMLFFSNHCDVFHNTITFNFAGIASGYNFDSHIFENTVRNNTLGIVTGYGSNTTIELNDVISSTLHGIVLQETNETIVKNNLIMHNNYTGIYLIGYTTGNNYNTITSNQIYNNRLGVGLNYLSDHNVIYLNEFIGNTINAQDNGTLNAWDNGEIGNSWDDYVGVDANDDGIGDTPYLIEGTAGSMDNFPIYEDGVDLAPVITIISPNPSDVFGTQAPYFEIDIESVALNSTWYTVNHGVNITFLGSSGYLDTTEWSGLGNGTVIITFYANNSKGVIGIAEVIVYKDILAPIIIINAPEAADEFTSYAPIYDITIQEANLDTMWYTIDNGITNFTITLYSGTIDETAWFSLPNGQVTIYFYANDTLGDIGSSYVIVFKNEPITPPPEIPGANPILILVILSIGIAGLIWQFKNKKLK